MALIALLGCETVLFAAQAKPPALSAAPTTNATALAEQPITQSIFIIPATPKEGRDPFFPQSVQAVPQPVSAKASPVDTSNFVLNGITPSGPRRTAMINGRTFETGETGEIKLPTGAKVMIKCEEIRNDSVIIILDGQRRELHFRFGV
jgi:hypothetical protein